jgi:hypothetical protein
LIEAKVLNMKNLLLHLLLIGVIIAPLGLIARQNLKIAPSNRLFAKGYGYESLRVEAEVQNISMETLRVEWYASYKLMPDAWKATLCEPGFCHPNIPNQGKFQPMLPREKGIIALNVTLANTQDRGELELVLVNANKGQILDTLLFVVESEKGVTSISPTKSFSEVQVFPNPVWQNQFYISFSEAEVSNRVSKVTLTNLMGREISGSFRREASRIIVQKEENLPGGLYIVSLYDDKGLIIGKIKIVFGG